MTTIRAHFDGRVFVPEEPVNLSASQEVELTVRELSASEANENARRSSPAHILEILRKLPSLPGEWMDEFDKAMEDGKIPARDEGIFDDLG